MRQGQRGEREEFGSQGTPDRPGRLGVRGMRLLVVVIWEGKEVRVIVFGAWDAFEGIVGVFLFRVWGRRQGSSSGRRDGSRDVSDLDVDLLVELFLFFRWIKYQLLLLDFHPSLGNAQFTLLQTRQEVAIVKQIHLDEVHCIQRRDGAQADVHKGRRTEGGDHNGSPGLILSLEVYVVCLRRLVSSRYVIRHDLHVPSWFGMSSATSSRVSPSIKYMYSPSTLPSKPADRGKFVSPSRSLRLSNVFSSVFSSLVGTIAECRVRSPRGMVKLTSSDANPARTAIWNLDEARWTWKFAPCKWNRFSFEGASSPSPSALVAEGLHDDRIQLKAEGRVVSTLANHQPECTHRRGSGSEIG